MKESTKKEIRFWVVMLAIFGTLYATGWHTEVIGRLQQVLLYTNLFQPTINEQPESQAPSPATADITRFIRPINALAEEDAQSGQVPQLYFINFWATWCPPCVAEMPDIASLKNHADQQNWPIRFLMISLDDQPQKARDFVTRKELPLPIYTLAGRLPSHFDTDTIPSTYVIDGQGRILAERHGMARYHTDSFVSFLESQLSTN
jgi:thiol-disulfide isomerase/thioredoxin